MGEGYLMGMAGMGGTMVGATGMGTMNAGMGHGNGANINGLMMMMM